MALSSRATGASYRQMAAATGLSIISVKRIAGHVRASAPRDLGEVERAAVAYGRAQSFADRIRTKAQVRAAAYEALEAGVDRPLVARAAGVPVDALDDFIEGVGLP